MGKRIFLSQVFGSPVPLLFPKRNLIEFHRFGETQQLDAIVFIGPVDDLQGKPYGRSLRSYARASLESLLSPRKIWLKESQIELAELNGKPCATATVSYEISKVGQVKGEFYLVIKDEKGFNMGYTAVPSEFDQYREEAMSIIQSFRFLESK
ncbi:MAG: hypothetical protein HY351_04605 [Candidatus Omnitrophica bacterium]|nr:hypothetical protein [Candidatus Omnitrophota bacterium]